MKNFYSPLTTSLFLLAAFNASTASAAKAKAHSSTTATAQQPGVADAPDMESCSQLIDQNCKELYKNADKPADPQPGNRDVPVGTDTLHLRLGENEQGLSYNLVAALQQKLASKDSLPADLKANYDKLGYFDDVQNFLKVADLKPASIQKQRVFDKLTEKIANKAGDAWQDTVVQRVEKKYPNYSTEEDPTNEELLYADDMDDALTKEATSTLWNGTPQWASVQKQFDEVQLNYVEYLKSRTNLSKSVRDAWIAKIRSVKLVPPDGEDGSACYTTEQNAMYRSDRNTFTVCAGLFTTTDDLRFVIAHELGHSIDPSGQSYDQEHSTSLSKTFVDLKQEVCGNAPMTSCPKNFAKLTNQAGFKKMLNEIKAPEHAPDSFYACLRYRKKLDPIAPEQIQSDAKNLDAGFRSQMSDNGLFLQLTQPETVNDHGRKERNVFYLNPCGKKKVKPEEVSVAEEPALLFVSAYLCSNNKDPVGRMEDAEKTSKAIQISVFEKKMAADGKFSDYPNMVESNHSEVVGERFADSLASGVYAHWLNSPPPKSLDDRRKETLAALDFFCDRPSLEEAHPREAQWQKERSFEPHSEGIERLFEIMKGDLRESLACKKDEGRVECSL